MTARAKRAIGIAVAAALLIGAAVLVIWPRLAGGGDGPGEGLRIVEGVIGSEKKPFFEDPEVQAVFAEHGLDVRITTAGSRQIATSVDLADVDFVFPSSAPAAERLRQATGASTVYTPFYSPMAIASYDRIAALLEAAGIATQAADGTWTFDMRAYLAAVEAGTRWNELPGAEASYNNSRTMLLASTDVRRSNSAAMYLAIASYLANGDRVVTSASEQAAVIDRMAALFLDQGYSASSSEAPFEEYLSQGVGSKPIVMIYEAQFLGRQLDPATASAITDDMVVMTPSPTVLSQHALIPLSDDGDLVGRLLVEDPRLAALAAEHGFRPSDPAVFASVLQERGIAVPPSPVDVIDPPSYERLESMIAEISGRYEQPADEDPDA